MIRYVRKHSGHEQRFALEKLERSIFLALHHIDRGDRTLARRIGKKTQEYLEKKGMGTVVGTNEIEQTVLHLLQEEGLREAAQSYELVSLHLPKMRLTKVVKRHGGTEPFHPQKLFKSLKKAFADTGITGGKIAEELTKKAIGILEAEHGSKPVPVRDVKRVAAHLLAERGFSQVEKRYILHKYL